MHMVHMYPEFLLKRLFRWKRVQSSCGTFGSYAPQSEHLTVCVFTSPTPALVHQFIQWESPGDKSV